MKLGVGLLVMIAGVVAAIAVHNPFVGLLGLVALYVGWKIETAG